MLYKQMERFISDKLPVVETGHIRVVATAVQTHSSIEGGSFRYIQVIRS